MEDELDCELSLDVLLASKLLDVAWLEIAGAEDDGGGVVPPPPPPPPPPHATRIIERAIVLITRIAENLQKLKKSFIRDSFAFNLWSFLSKA